MRLVHVVTHPEVRIDPAIPVTRWSLSDTGRARMQAFAAWPRLRRADRLFCSTEAKAVEAAQILQRSLGLSAHAVAALGENDRSATGFLHKEAFEQAADEFFAHPAQSFRGWERAVDAQRRIVDAMERLLREAGAGDTVVVSHGAVGTLLKCHLKGCAITRAEDQPAQGHVYTFEAATRRLLHDWRRLEDAAADAPA
ncbi:MAG TPA: histidine phosphatase family protein [Burkholderiaceae bacterium]